MNFLKNILSSALGSVIGFVVGGTILIFVFVSIFVGGLVSAFSDLDSDNIDAYDGDANVLVVNLDAAIVERGVEPFTFNIFDMSASPQIGLDQILDGLQRASEDDKIKGILLQVDGVSAGPSTLEDIRRGLEDFKSSGKWIVAWSETMSQTGYFMSSVADEVYLHPNGGMELLGLRSLAMFYPGLLEKLGIDVTVLRGPNNKFKSAVEPIIRSDFSEANKVQMNALLADIWDMIRSGIADSRGIAPQQIDDIAENILLRLPVDALELGLIDDLFYEDQRDEHLEHLLDSLELSTLSFGEYTLPERMFGFDFSDPEALVNMLDEISAEAPDNDSSDSDPLGGEIAVIYAVGGIESGAGDATTIGSVTIAAAIKKARLAPDVKAVVLRVNSPGGSALASDVIWRETILLKEAGKHFIVSMSDLAASGGYYISCAADKIYANPTTITGSIGVFGIIPNWGGAYEMHLGLTFDEVSTHSHAGKPDGLFAMSPFEIAAYNEIISDIYDDFTSKVADGRGMTREQVEEVARGRVWTGSDALEIGLVDELGSLNDAVEYAESLIGDGPATKVYLPEAQDPFEQIMQDMMGVRAGLDALDMLEVDSWVIDEIISVKKMIQSGDIYQTRMPFSIHFD